MILCGVVHASATGARGNMDEPIVCKFRWWDCVHDSTLLRAAPVYLVSFTIAEFYNWETRADKEYSCNEPTWYFFLRFFSRFLFSSSIDGANAMHFKKWCNRTASNATYSTCCWIGGSGGYLCSLSEFKWLDLSSINDSQAQCMQRGTIRVRESK